MGTYIPETQQQRIDAFSFPRSVLSTVDHDSQVTSKCSCGAQSRFSGRSLYLTILLISKKLFTRTTTSLLAFDEFHVYRAKDVPIRFPSLKSCRMSPPLDSLVISNGRGKLALLSSLSCKLLPCRPIWVPS